MVDVTVKSDMEGKIAVVTTVSDNGKSICTNLIEYEKSDTFWVGSPDQIIIEEKDVIE